MHGDAVQRLLRETAERLKKGTDAAVSATAAEIVAIEHPLKQGADKLQHASESSARAIRHSTEGTTGLVQSDAGSRRGVDLSSVPPAAELMNVPLHDADNRKLTRQLKGWEQEYGPYRLEGLQAEYSMGADGVDGFNMNAIVMEDVDVGVVRCQFRKYPNGSLSIPYLYARLDAGKTRKGFTTAFLDGVERYGRHNSFSSISFKATSLGSGGTMNGGLFFALKDYQWNPKEALKSDSIENVQRSIAEEMRYRTPADQRKLSVLAEKLTDPDELPTPKEIATLRGENDQRLGGWIMNRTTWWAFKDLQL